MVPLFRVPIQFAYEADFKLIRGIPKGKSIEFPYVADCHDFSVPVFSLIIHFVAKVEVYIFAFGSIFSCSIPFFLSCLCVEKNGLY